MPRVLIVDDEPVLLTSLSLLLGAEGFEVQTADNGREALDRAESFVPDVLVVDWILRDRVDGIEVAAALRGLRPELGVVVMSGHCSSQLRSQMDELGAVQCLQKPFWADEFLAAVRACTG